MRSATNWLSKTWSSFIGIDTANSPVYQQAITKWIVVGVASIMVIAARSPLWSRFRDLGSSGLGHRPGAVGIVCPLLAAILPIQCYVGIDARQDVYVPRKIRKHWGSANLIDGYVR